MLCYVAMIIIKNIDTQNDTCHNIIGPYAYNINAVLGFYIDQYVQLGCLFELAWVKIELQNAITLFIHAYNNHKYIFLCCYG